MKKTLLALAVAALSANAFAVNLDDNTATQNYASEIVVASSGTVLQGATASVTAGFALATDGYVRFELTNGAKFDGTVALATTGASVFTISAGGAGSDYVIFRTDGSGIANNETLTLTSDVKVANKNAVSVSYALYETAANAVAESGALASKSGTLLSFKSALTVSAIDSVTQDIDAIGSEAKQFTGAPLTADLTTLSVALTAPAPLLATGVAPTAVADLISAYNWTLNGNFSAVAAAGIVDATPTAFTIAEDKQSATLDNADGLVTYTVTGNDEIAETTVSAVFSATPVAGFAVANVTIADAAVLEKNGSTRDVDLALKPGGAYSNFVRISNKDTIEGAFSIRVINDAGEAVTVALNEVAGQPATLAAGASTEQMSIQDIFDAAAAKGLTLSGQGKLRLEVTGQVNDLDVQTYTVSKDGNSFATF
jgi:hypothetical protein